MAIVPSEVVADPGTDRVRHWQPIIESGVGLLSSVTNLNVDLSGLFKLEISKNDVLSNFAKDPDPDVIGHPEQGSFIGFDLTIPRRKHKKLFPWIKESLGCERFRFTTIYATDGPVTFIRAMEGIADGADPAHMVALVREFLIEEFRSSGAPVSLMVTGPSPFHARFVLTAGDSAGEKKDLDWQRRSLGYDVVTFYSDPKVPTEDAYTLMMVKVCDSFARYYQLVRARDRRRARADIVSGLAEILVERHLGIGVRGWFVRTFRSGRLARALMLDVIRSKQLEIEEISESEDSLSKADAGLQLSFLEEVCQEEASASYAMVLDASQEIVRTLEVGRIKSYEVFVLAASTVLGGAAGAIAALLAG